MVLRDVSVALAFLALAACGGGGSSTPTTMPAGPAVESFMGTSSVSATGACSSTNMGHSFQSGEGTTNRIHQQVAAGTTRLHGTVADLTGERDQVRSWRRDRIAEQRRAQQTAPENQPP